MSGETKIIALQFRPGNIFQSFPITGEMLLNNQFSDRKLIGRLKNEIRNADPGTDISVVFVTGQSINFHYGADDEGDYVTKSRECTNKIYLDQRECDRYLGEVLKQFGVNTNEINKSINQLREFPDRLERDLNSFAHH